MTNPFKQYVVSIMQRGVVYPTPDEAIKTEGIPGSVDAWAFLDSLDALEFLEGFYTRHEKAVLTVEPVKFEIVVRVEGGVVYDVELFSPWCMSIPFALTMDDRDVKE